MNNLTQPNFANLGKKINFKLVSTLGFLLLLLTSNLSYGQSNHTVTFSGSAADFNTAEKFSAAANNTDYYITFDANYMYFAAFRTSGVFGTTDNFSIYLDTDPRNTLASGNGSTGGRLYNGFTPTLPFNADYTSITEQSYTEPLNRYSGGWASTGVTPTTFTSSTCREVRIALSALGNPASVYATVWMGYAGGIFSNAPGTSNEGTAATRTMTGFFGSFPVYKTGVTPVSFRTQNITAANGGGTAISNLTVASGVAITAGDYGDITLSNAAATSTLGGNTSFTGTFSIGTSATSNNKLGLSTYTLTAGGRGIGGTAGVLSVNGTSTAPITTGTGGKISFLGAGLVSRTNTAASIVLFPASSTVTIGGAVDFGNVGTTTPSALAGTLQINANGSVNTNPPTYNVGSTLVYNTGGTYTAGAEWTTNSASAKGVPQAVTIQNNTAVNFGSSAAYRQANGLVTIGSGSSLTLSTVSGGDLKIAAGLTNSNTGSGVGINTNGRALFNVGTGTYTKTGTDNLDFLLLASANTLTLATGTNLNLTNTNVSGALQFSNASAALAMAGTNTVTLDSGTTVAGTTAGAISGASPTTSILSTTGTCNWSPGGIITVGSGVGIQLNGGLTNTTATRLNAFNVQINQGGYVSTNPIVYGSSSTLTYNHNSGSYGIGANEWPAASSPTNVTVNSNGGTGIDFGSNNITARTIAGTLTIAAGQNVNLNGSGTPNLTVLNTIAGAGSTISGTGNYTQTASGSFTTANTGGINGTLTTSGTKTLPTTTSFTFNNATTSQVTGTLLPATIAALTINNPTASSGTTISNNTLVISGTTTLTAGALVLPTGASNLVTFTGAIGGTSGTITGNSASNISTTTLTSPFNLAFTAGGQALNNWTLSSSTFGSSTPQGLSSPLSISGTLTQPSSGDLYSTSAGALTILSGGTYDQQSNGWYRGAGSITINSGATFKINDSGGLMADASAGAVQTTGTKTFSGGANYIFNNSSTQAIGTALDGAGGTGKTGAITGNVTVTQSSGFSLTAGVNLTINTPGTFTLGVASTSSATLIASATSVINGTGNVTFTGNGATSGSTLQTAHANGVNGTIQASGTISLTNGANNNTNFTFNGSVAQTTGALLPATVNNLSFINTFTGSVASPSVTLSSSTTVAGTTTFAGGTGLIGVVSIGASNTLTLNGAITFTNVAKLIGTSTSNLIIGGSGTIGASSLFASGGGSLNNFTMNRTGQTILPAVPLTVSGTFSLTAGVVSMSTNTLTLNGPIAFGAGTLTSTGPLTIGGTGAITGSLTGTASPLALSTLTMGRSGATLTLGTPITLSNGAGALALNAGIINLGSNDLTLNNVAGTVTTTGTLSNTTMVRADSTGRLGKLFNSGASSFTFPIGDVSGPSSTADYSPATLAFSANSVATGIFYARVVNTAAATGHPQLNLTGSPQANYLDRYWVFSNGGTVGTYTYQGTFNYVTADINGTEANIKADRWNGTAWTEPSGSSAASNVLTTAAGLTNVTAPLSATCEYTGRVEPSASIVLSSNTIAAGNITQSTTLNPIYSFAIDATGGNSSLTGLTVTTTGTYVSADVTNLKCYYQTSSTFNSGTAVLLSTFTSPGIAGSKAFPTFTSQVITAGTTGYIFITTDVPCATIGNTIAISAVTSANTTFSSGTVSGTPSAGNTQTFAASTPVNATGMAASTAASSSSISWTNPTGCYDGVMIVVSPAANTGGTPSGDGTAYTANLAYGSGTGLGNGFVVYKGSTSSQTVTGLTNGTTYYVKFFTRVGSVWSAGTEITVTPALTYCTNTNTSSTSYFLSNVTITGGVTNFNNTSTFSANGYGNFTSTHSTSQYQGGSVSYSITSGYSTMKYGVWVDWNENGLFTDAGENVVLVTGYAASATRTFAIPNGTLVGSKRMRVVGNFSITTMSASQYCPGTGTTECEDYTFTVLAPAIVLADNGTQVAAANVSPGTTNLVLQQSQLTVTGGPASLTGMTCTTAGTYASADVTNLKAWYSTSSTFSSGTSTLLSTFTTPGAAGAKTFPSFATQSVATGTGYIFITADIASGATNSNTINLSALATSDFTFASANKSGSSTAGGAQTFVSSSVAIADNGTQVGAANISGGTSNVVLHQSKLTVSSATASLTGMTCTTAGSYVSADITNLKVYYSTNSTFSVGASTLLSTLTTPGVAGAKTFSTFTTQALSVGTAYIYITADVASAASNGSTINVSALTTSDYTFASGSKSGSTSAGGTQTLVVPTVVLANNGTQVAASTVDAGTTNVLLHQSQLSVTNAAATLTGMTCTTAGTYASADVTNLKAWYSTSSTFNSGTATLLSTLTTPGVAGAKTFTSFTTQSISSGSTGYIYITADIAAAATNANTINVSALATTNFTFSSVSISGSGSAGGVKTIFNYCIPTRTATGTYIDSFSTTGGTTTNITNNSTGAASGGYANYTATNTVTQIPNGIINCTLTYVGGTASVNVFVDWNNNGSFADTGEYVYTSSVCVATGTYNPVITVPNGQAVGSYRMRVLVDYNCGSSSCSYSSGRGETEDYTITVLATPTYYLQANTDPSVKTNWGTNTDGTGTNPSAMNIVANWNVSQNSNTPTTAWANAWTLAAGSSIVVKASSTFNIAGTLDMLGQQISAGASATVNVTSNGTVKTSNAAGFSGTTSTAISSTNTPTVTLDNASTVEYNGSSAQTVTNGVSYGNLTISSPSAVVLTLAGAVTVNGNLSMTNGAYFNLGNATANNNLTVNGNLSLTNNSYIDCNASSLGTPSYIYLKGNLSLLNGTGTSARIRSQGGTTGRLYFNSNSTQTFTSDVTASIGALYYYIGDGTTTTTLNLTSNIILNSSTSTSGSLIVSNNSTLNLSTYNVSYGQTASTAIFNINSGATLKTSNTGGLTGTATSSSTGSINSTYITSTFTAGAKYVFNGATTTPFPTTFGNPADVTINAAVTLNKPVTISNALNLAAVLTTTSTNIPTLTNVANTAITGASSTAFINGPVTWTLGSASTGSYIVPVGVGTAYYPLAFTAGSNTGSPTITVTPNASSVGSADASTLFATSGAEYWSVVTTAGFNASNFSLGRSTPALGNLTLIGKNTANSSYVSIGGTVGTLSGQPSVNDSSSGISGAATNYLTLAQKLVSVTYNGNSTSATSVPSATSYGYNTTATVSGAGSMVNLNYTFNGWNTAADGSGTSYSASATFTITSNVTLYAQWIGNLTYNLNTGSGTIPTDATNYIAGSTVTVASNSGISKVGYTFANWNAASDGTGASYSASSTFSFSGSLTLYAQWTANTNTITFNGNGNDGGSMSPQSLATNATANLSANGFTLTNYTFSGWALTSSGAATYLGGASFTMGTSDITLYAVWVANSAPICPSVTSISPSAAQSICVGGSSNQLTASVTNSGNTGSPTVQYQWYYNTSSTNLISGTTVTLSGANSSTYTPLTTASEVGTRYYFCVSYATDNGCTSTATTGPASTPVQVTVNALPTVGLGAASVCVGSTINLSPNTGGTWVSNAPTYATVVSGTGVVTGVAVGSSTFTFTQTSTGCQNTTSSMAVNAFPVFTQQPSSSTQTICSGGTSTALSVSVSPVSTYQWYSNTSASNSSGAAISNEINNSYTPSTTTTGTKYYYVTATNNGCSTTSSVSAGITINESPAAPTASNPAAICAGTPINIVATSAGNTINWYNDATGGTAITTLVASGANYSVSPSATKTYYAETQATSAGTPQTVSYTSTGSNQTWTVPEGVTSINVKMWGAGGAGSNYSATYISSGGSGGFVSGTLAVTPGQVLNLVVGSGGKVYSNNTVSQYGGGGPAGSGTGYSGGGGGRSAIQFVSGTDYVTVGGGGGAGPIRYDSAGNNAIGLGYGGAGGGLTGGSSSAARYCGLASGGTQSAGGTNAGSDYNGGSGSQYLGGNGASDLSGAGGGGGGYYGGGGGGVGWWYNASFNTVSNGNGGGGGSSYVANLTSATNTQGNINSAGAQAAAPSNTDLNYVSGVGIGGAGGTSNNGGNGLIVITYTAPVAGCVSATRTPVTVTVNAVPTANSGAAMSAICSGATSAALGGSVGGSATGGTWTHNGSGTLANASNPSTATYTAGASESGTVTLTLTTTGGGCTAVTATKTIVVNAIPAAPTTPVNLTICNAGSGNISITAPTLTSSQNVAFNIATEPTETNASPGNQIATATISALPTGTTITSAALTLNGLTALGSSWMSDVYLGLSGAVTYSAVTGSSTITAGAFNYSSSVTTGFTVNTSSTSLNLLYWDYANDNTSSVECTFGAPKTANLTLNYSYPATINWYAAATGGTLLGTGATFNPVGTSVLPDTNTAGTYNFYAAATNNGCESSRVLVTVTINQISVAPTSLSASTATICNGNNTTLTQTGGSLGTGAVWQWYTNNTFTTTVGGTLSSSNASLSVSPTTTTTYYLRAISGTSPCAASVPATTPSTVSVIVTVNQPSVAPTSLSASTATICNGNNTTLTQSGGSLGTGAVWQWYSDASFSTTVGGTLSASNASLSVSPTTTTTYYLRAINGTSPCAASVPATTPSTVSVTVTVNQPSVAPTSISGTTTICTGSSTTLTATGGTLGTGANYQWGTGSVVGTNTIAGETSATLTVSPTSNTTYWVRITNGTAPCTATSSGVTATVTVNALQTISLSSAAGTTAQTVCSGTAISSIVYAIGGLGTGASVSGLPSGMSGAYASGVFTISGSSTTAGNYTYTVTTSGANSCTASLSGTITVNAPALDWFNIQFPTTAQTICAGSTLTAYGQVYKNGVTAAAGQTAGLTAEVGWSTANTDPSTWTNWSAATFNVQSGNNDEFVATFGSGLAAGTYYYAFRYSYNSCYQYGAYNGAWNGTTNTNAVLNIDAQPTTAAAGSTQTICEGTTATLAANSPTVGTGAWTITSGPNTSTAQLSSTSSTSAVFTPTAAGTYTLRWTISNGACTSSTSNVQIVVTSGILDYVNLQWAPTATICQGSTFDAYGKVYEAGVTANSGADSAIQVQFGYNSTNTNPNSWTNWADASYNTQSGNDDEYKITTGDALAAGTYYYTFRYKLNGCSWQYGGYSSTGGGTWGGSNVSGVLTVNSLPNQATATSTNSCGTATLTATAAGSATAIWYSDTLGNNPVSTSGNPSVFNVYNPSVATTYYAYTSLNGCRSLNYYAAQLELKPTSIYTDVSGDHSWFTASNWDCNVVPTATTNVIIPTSKTVSVYYDVNGSPAYANTISLQGTANVTVTSDHSMNVTNKVTVASGATFTVQNRASLVQTDNVANEGSIVVNKSTPSDRLLKIYDAVMWSSPVSQKLKAMSTGTLDAYFMQHAPLTNSWASISSPSTTDFTKGKGYLVRTPMDFSFTQGQQWNVSFTGVPNNGAITYDAGNMDSVERFLLVGNPYPSAISIAAFKAANPNITGVFYFFRKPNEATDISGYGTLNSAGDFTSNDGTRGALQPGSVIPSGQGFFVRMKSNSNDGKIYFTNAMRVANDHGHFNRANANQDMYRLLVQTPTTGNNQLLVKYDPDTTVDYDLGVDAVAFTDGTTDLSSIMNTKNYRIQARGDYNAADVIPLRFKTGVAGEHRIKLQDVQGVFAADQMVCIKDNVTGTLHNLTANGDYVFTATAGTFTNRFEVVYQQAYYTALQSVSCGSTLSNMSSLVYADVIEGASGYRFKVVNNTTSSVQTIDRQYHWFALNMLPSYDYNTAYSISVQVQKDGVWVGYYGTPCSVNSPNIASTGIMQINPSQCGVTLPTLGYVIATTPVAGATGYKFRITNTTAGASGANLVQEITRTNHWFTLAMLARYNYGSSYAIEVAVKTTGGYTPYGNACTVYSPAVPTLVSCGQAVATATTLVRTTAMTSATQYRFQVTRMATQETITFDTANYWFSFRVNVPGYAAGEQYGVRIAVMTAGAWSPYGDACEITAPIATARTSEQTAPSDASLFKPVAYPNPFKSEFSIALATPYEEEVTLVVYDLQGRLIEKQTVPVTLIDTIHIGANYQMGDYMLVVSQGPAIESMLLHKE